MELLLEALEAYIDGVNGAGAKAFQTSDYDAAHQAMEVAASITALRAQARDLARRWRNVRWVPVEETAPDHSNMAPNPDTPPPAARRGQRLPRGLRTPAEAYRTPILASLLELGGQGPADRVLASVYRKMDSVLNEYDRQFLGSRDDPRWSNTARWCRNDLADEGLIDRSSPRGVWALTEAGREAAEALLRKRSE